MVEDVRVELITQAIVDAEYGEGEWSRMVRGQTTTSSEILAGYRDRSRRVLETLKRLNIVDSGLVLQLNGYQTKLIGD